MPKACFICKKAVKAGRHTARRGMAKAKGGAGRKILRRTIRKFRPNLQRVKILVKGKPKRVFVCTKCLKAGKIQKAA